VFVKADMMHPRQLQVPANTQRSACAGLPGAATLQTPREDDDMPYYSDIMADAMF
jgi:hypothetical protein